MSQNEYTQKLPESAPQTREEALARLAAMQERLVDAKQRMDAKTAFFMQQYQSRPEDKHQGACVQQRAGLQTSVCVRVWE